MSAANDLLLATNNPKKVQEIRGILGSEFSGKILIAADFPQFSDPEETGSTFAENARLKAQYYATRTGLASLADDSGLVVDALGGRPGVHSARYAPTDTERIEKLLNELKDSGTTDRSARFVCAMCLCLPDSRVFEQTGVLEGEIGLEPRGCHGFGYDPVFIVKGGPSTLAELDPEVKNSISHRGQAMKKIRPDLLNALTPQ